MNNRQKRSFEDLMPSRTFPVLRGDSLPSGSSFLMTLLFLLLCFSGCAVGPNFTPPAPPTVARYTPEPEPTKTVSAGGKVQQFNRGAEITADWWRLFESDKLDTIVKMAITRNQDLQAAQARLRRSQEILRAGYGGFFPQADGSLDASRQKFNASRFGSSAAATIFNLYTATAAISYNLDVFGSTRRTVESLEAQKEYQRYQVQATYLTLLNNVINAIIAQASYRDQIRATEEILTYERRQIEIVETQAEVGVVPRSEVLSVRSQLASTEATLPPLRQSLSQSGHLLATLLDYLPAQWTPPEIHLTDLKLPEELPVSLPSKLTRQRPDILAAEAQLHSASAQIGVATAALFPSLNLSASFGQSNTELDGILNSGGNFWSMGANLAGPLFRGGTLWSQRKAAIEAYQESLANYRQTVLSAFAQVADVLKALEHDAQTLTAQTEALRNAEENLNIVQDTYQAGVANYLDVLNADRQYQEARIGYIRAQTQRYQDTVALFQALGGGWWNTENHQESKGPEKR